MMRITFTYYARRTAGKVKKGLMQLGKREYLTQTLYELRE